MSNTQIAKHIEEAVGAGRERINIKAYNIKKITVAYGLPPVVVEGLDYVIARHMYPQTVYRSSLNGTGKFVGNNNQSGIIEIGVLEGSPSAAALDLLHLTGISFPLVVVDETTGGTGTVVGTACRQVDVREWRRSASVNIRAFRYAATRLVAVHGIRLFDN
jgi:hypothetical protein